MTTKIKKKNISITISEDKINKIKLFWSNKSRFIEKSLDYYISKLEKEKLKKAYIEDKDESIDFAEEAILVYKNQ